MEPVAFSTWVGIIAAIAGIVLSLVAIAFAVLVDLRSRQLSDQTIRSLQKIESAVERLSDDTQELIKAAWDKLLGAVDRQPGPAGEVDAKQLASGLAAELRAELATDKSRPRPAERPEQANRLEQVIANLQSSVEALLRDRPSARSPSRAIDRLVEVVSPLSAEARALLPAIYGGHLTRQQYQQAVNSPVLGPPVQELRSVGLLVPVVHTHPDGTQEPCYYFPPGFGRVLAAGRRLLPPVPADVRAQIRSALLRVGYPDHSHGTADAAADGSDPRNHNQRE